ncbi:DUF1738 domain-containing protein [Pedobacter frigidisoli]|uniref:DUF1738 domain-containing protein n=1 Tax=Pedobacter frigidisoli TaxID=2530455 RepID=A0A4R0NZ21_9SPHI|nr:zincin-like metallopeptidase domain-containing protein [Pedobacter frigidisoli]TCD07700.1 DUF1738 domain-containing protein [Pedobacter frigidisoli]
MDIKQLPLHMQVAQRLIEQLKAGTVPWQKPWSDEGVPIFSLPYNEQTGKRYQGINILNLMLAGREDPRWMTFKQAEANGFRVNQGEKGTMIQFVKTHEQKTMRDEHGKVVHDELGKAVVLSRPLERAVIRNAWLFNGEQVSGLSPLGERLARPISWDPLERAENLIASSGADIGHMYIDQAYYDIRYDAITMPERSQFATTQGYYATLLHELGHWTGHPDRLDRATLMNSGAEAYAREELRAEISSILMGDELRIPYDASQHTSYIESWVSILQDTPFEIFSAAADAERIFAHLIGLEQKRLVQVQPVSSLDMAASTPSLSRQNYLSTGDEISYNDQLYRIQGHLKQGRLKVELMPSGTRFTLSKTDKLYSSLLEVKLSVDRGVQPGLINLGSGETLDQSKIKR